MNFKIINCLIDLFDQAKQHNLDKNFLFKINKDKKIESFSWREADEHIKNISNFLLENKVVKGDRILLVSENRPEWLLSDLAILKSGAITVPNYTTYTIKDFEFILNDCLPKGLIVSNAKLLNTIQKACENINYKLQFIILFDKENTNFDVTYFYDIKNNQINNHCEIKRTDPACIIYTSGTQGTPKGVLLSHGGILCNVEGAIEIINEIKINKFRFLTWLPLSHSYEHTVQFVQIALFAEIFYCANLERLMDTIKISQPHIMTAVPRFYNNLYNKMQPKLKESYIFSKTVDLGSKIFLGQKVNILERLSNKILNYVVRKKVVKNFGGNLKAFISGGGPLDKNIGVFLNSVGLRTLQGYGLTEFSPVVSCNPINKIKIETVGVPFKNIKVKINQDGEILVQGESLMMRYWNNEKATNDTIQNGWLHTGDIGEIDHEGYLKITDRKKDIIVNSGGDNISPAKIENLLCINPEIEQSFVYGDNKNYLVALLVLNKEFNLTRADIQIVVDKVNKELTAIEKIKNFAIINQPFSIENNMLTPTMKIKRHVIKNYFKELLNSFYAPKN